MTRLESLQESAREAGYYVGTWSPGDGVTRYRFFRLADIKPDEQSYFGPANGVFTALGLKQARTWLSGASSSAR